MLRILVYDRLGTPKGELSPNDVLQATMREEVNGEHSLEILTTQVLEKGQRLVCQDAMGTWREFAVSGVDAEHAAGSTVVGTYYCVWSIQEDLMGVTVSVMPGVQNPCNAGAALAALLSSQTRWAVGTVTNLAMGGASMYDRSAWQALSTLVENWGGEVDATIEVDDFGVIARKVDLYATQGASGATRRFDYGADVAGVTRETADEPLYCRVSPRGKGEETDSGGYGRKITIESVNGGLDYLTYSPMVDVAKLPDGQGGYIYPTKIIENADCETPSELKDWANSVLASECTPTVSYSIDVAQSAMAGESLHGIALGDPVQVVDRCFADGLRVQARAVSITTDLLAGRVENVELGSVTESVASQFAKVGTSVATMANTLTAMGTAQYVDELIGRLNAEINATGGYTYIVPGQGIVTYDKEVSDPSVGAEADAVVEVRGGTIRIADSRTAQGAWDWHSVFTSGHIAADLVTAVSIVAGTIGSASSGNYWNLDTGELRMAATSYLGTKTVQQVIDGVDATITDVDVEFAQNQSTTTAPTSGWSTTAPAWRDGWYIWQRTATTNASGVSYSTPTCISGKNGADGTSVTILGSYDTLADLEAAHPTGSLGDGYIVAGDLYVWNGTAWENVGTIQGPQDL